MLQLNLLLEYVAADSAAAMSFVGQEPAQNGQAGCIALEEQKTVRILDRSLCVCVCVCM